MIALSSPAELLNQNPKLFKIALDPFEKMVKIEHHPALVTAEKTWEGRESLASG
jgi:hypothetical protein